jgi:hypothetical protein
MSNNAAWLILSFAIMVVAVLATLYEKVQQLEKRLNRLDAGGEPDDDGRSAPVAGSIAPEALGHGDRRIR